MSELLRVSEISKVYGKTKVVDRVSFEVNEGEIMGVLGPNGAGKTTTIRCIMGIIQPDSGTINFSFAKGKGIQRSQIGYLPEERGLYRDVAVMDVLLYLARLKNYPLDKARKRALHYLDRFGLAGKDRSKVEQLSKGMAQKVQFIASIIHEPRLVVLDEPFSGLDPVSQDVFREEIKELANSGMTILLSSHQMNVVEQLIDRIFLINKGQQVVYGPLQAIKEDFANFKCEIAGSNDHVDLERLSTVDRVQKRVGRTTVYLAKDASPNDFLRELPTNVDVKELSIDRISLHDIFVRIATGGNSDER